MTVIINDKTVHLAATNRLPADDLRRFTVAAGDPPDGGIHRIRSDYVEANWLTWLGPVTLMFARRCDIALTTQHRAAFDIARLADELGCRPTQVIAATHKLERYGLATWSPRDTTLTVARRWPPVSAAMTTEIHRSVLLDIDDETITR